MSSEQAYSLLVVDDDAAVRALLAAALRGHGLTVRTAAGGVEAVEYYRHHSQEISVVLLDVLMPGMDGPQTLQTLHAIDPHLPCCFMTGGTGAYTEQQLLDLGACHIFAKPFGNLDEVARLLKQAAAPGRLPAPHIRTRQAAISRPGKQP